MLLDTQASSSRRGEGEHSREIRKLVLPLDARKGLAVVGA